MSDTKAEFGKLFFAAFISQIGSHLLTLSLAGYVYVQSKSPVWASLVFVVSFLPAVGMSAKIGALVDRRVSKRLIITTEMIAIGLSILCGYCINMNLGMYVLCVALAFRSVVTFTGRTAFQKWIKLISDPDNQTNRIKLFLLGFFLSTVFAGVATAFLLSDKSIFTVVIIDVLTYLFGIGIVLTLRAQHSNSTSSKDLGNLLDENLITIVKEILDDPKLRNHFWLIAFSQSIFQGVYSVYVYYLPINHLKKTMNWVGLFQIGASLGIIGAFVILWIRPNILKMNLSWFSNRLIPIIFGVGIVAIYFVASIDSAIFSILGFLIVNLCYEMLWLFGISEYFRDCPPAKTARYQFACASIAALMMSFSILIFSAICEYTNRGSAELVTAFASIGFIIFLNISSPTVSLQERLSE